MKEFLDLAKTLIYIGTILWILFSFVIGIEIAPNEDMKPRIMAGDLIIYYRLDKRPEIREIIVLKKNNTDYIGRVVASGGDKVEVTEDSALMVNDNIVLDDNIFSGTPLYEGFLEYPVVLEPDECFVLSDRREGGEDSRYYGPVEYSEVLGTVIGQYRRGST